MKPIDRFEAAHMTEEQLVHECWERNCTYYDYFTNCDVLGRSAISRDTFNALYRTFDTRMAASIASRSAVPHDEAKYFRSL